MCTLRKRPFCRPVFLAVMGLSLLLASCTGGGSMDGQAPTDIQALPPRPAAAPTTGQAPAATAVAVPSPFQAGTAAAPAGATPAVPPATTPGGGEGVTYIPDVAFTLKTAIAEGKLAFVGVGGSIDGVTNPTLQVQPDQVVQVTLVNGDAATHDISFPDFGVTSEQVTGQDASTAVVFRTGQAGEFPYYCTIPGHRAAGMEGKLVVGEGAATQPQAASLAHDPADLPPPIGDRPTQTVRLELETIEVDGQLAPGATLTYWTFNGQVPGPMARVRVGDRVEVHLKNSANSMMIHSIDLHAVTGPGGGASVTQVPPGEERSFTFRPLNPGLYVYHCGTPMVSQHIANGMYGLILVEPEGGLPPVDREFYVMQGEIYTQAPYGQHGHQEFSVEKLLAETPEYYVFNGAVGALTDQHPLTATVGETIRIFFAVGGPNKVSSFHIIGEILDRVYNQGSLTSPPLTNVQTTLVPPGGSAMIELQLQVPGRYILVDHALARTERGLVGYLQVEGAENPALFQPGPD